MGTHGPPPLGGCPPRQGYTDGLFLPILDSLLWKIEDRRWCRPWWRQEEEAR